MKTLGLDIGTTSISSVIFREKTGVLEAKTIANGTFLPSESWERLQNPAAIWQKAFRVVSELLQRHPDVRAIGVTGQMHSFMNGMAQELYGMYRSFLDAGGTAPKKIIGSGNGLRKNVHLCRAFEAVFGCPLILSSCEEEAAAGAAMYAARHEKSRRS